MGAYRRGKVRQPRYRGAVIAACCLALVLTLSGTATGASRAKPAKTRVTIQTWPKGLFGYVSSPKAARCAAGRRVVVFDQRGRRPNPAKDRRIARVRAAGRPGAYQWSIKTARRGRFYARAVSKPRCRVANSRTVVAAVASVLGGGEGATYPPCSPYVSEGTTTICRFPRLHLNLVYRFGQPCSSWGDNEGRCDGYSIGGAFPWGGGDHGVSLFWKPGPYGRRAVTMVAYSPSTGDVGIAHLGGTLWGRDSPRFTIEDGFAADDRGYPNGEHFYTPDIPGQEAGEVGGPLHLDFINGHPGADAYIDGYLYLK